MATSETQPHHYSERRLIDFAWLVRWTSAPPGKTSYLEWARIVCEEADAIEERLIAADPKRTVGWIDLSLAPHSDRLVDALIALERVYGRVPIVSDVLSTFACGP